VDKGHGRIETRTIEVATRFKLPTHIPFINQVFRISRERTDLKGTLLSREIEYGITSLSAQDADPKRLARLVRGHWTIENSSHYVRDETLGEDRSRIRKQSGPRVMATIRNLALAICRLLNFQIMTDAFRYFSWSPKKEILGFLGLGKV
jgi:predicted transposase YbfD/YdcC